MHIIDLMVEHGLGIVTRTQLHVVVDEFPEGERGRTYTFKTVDIIMDKRSKGRHKVCQKVCDDSSCK